jgi:disulfide oxidoreductase YuzD
MNEIIKVKIYGIKKQLISSGCGCSDKKNGCCSSSKGKKSCCNSGEGGCANKTNKCSTGNSLNISKTVGDSYKELEEFINNSDVKNNTELEFIDIEKIDLEEDEFLRIKEIIHRGFEPPIIVVDDIIRYYGGIPNTYIYKDIKELME